MFRKVPFPEQFYCESASSFLFRRGVELLFDLDAVARGLLETLSYLESEFHLFSDLTEVDQVLAVSYSITNFQSFVGLITQ